MEVLECFICYVRGDGFGCCIVYEFECFEVIEGVGEGVSLLWG